jgi:hypothetical protein
VAARLNLIGSGTVTSGTSTADDTTGSSEDKKEEDNVMQTARVKWNREAGKMRFWGCKLWTILIPTSTCYGDGQGKVRYMRVVMLMHTSWRLGHG